MNTWIRRNSRLLAVFAGLTVGFSAIGILRHHNYWSGALDLGVFDQGAWLLSHGHAHVSSIDRHILVDHVSPVLLIFGVLYKIYASPNVLIVIQALAVAATVFPLARLAKREGAPPWFAVTVFALSASVLAAITFDFHASVLAPPAVAWMIVGIREQKMRIAVLGAVAILICRADMLFVVLAGVVLARSKQMRVVLLGISALGALMVAVPGLLDHGSNWEIDYSNLGTGPGDALMHPWRIVPALLSIDAIKTLVIFLAPVAFLPVLVPRWLLALVVACFPLLPIIADGPHLPWFHYGAPFTPFAIGGACVALTQTTLGRRIAPRGVIVAAVVAALLLSPLAPHAPEDRRWWSVLKKNPAADFESLVSAVPSDAAVASVDPIASHLTHRSKIYGYPVPFFDAGPQGPAPSSGLQRSVEYVVVDGQSVEEAQSLGFTKLIARSGEFQVRTREAR